MNISNKLLAAFVSVTLLFSFVAPGEAQEINGTEISFNDFGADNSGKHDSGPAIIKLLESVKNRDNDEKVTLTFEPGTYRITKETALIREVHTSNTDSISNPN